MPKAKKRKPDLRLIRPSKTYTVPEIASGLQRDIRSVRRWIREGLPTLDRQRPILIDGATLRSWLKERWQARKTKCSLDELFCFGCGVPRRPAAGTVRIEPRNAKTLCVEAKCEDCGTEMNKAGSLSRLAEIEAQFRPFTPEKSRLVGCGDTSVNDTFGRSKVAAGE